MQYLASVSLGLKLYLFMQARMLTEEWERREILEKLQEEQKEMLNQERSKREEWEHVGNEKADQMREAERMVTKSIY